MKEFLKVISEQFLRAKARCKKTFHQISKGRLFLHSMTMDHPKVWCSKAHKSNLAAILVAAPFDWGTNGGKFEWRPAFGGENYVGTI
jgi:hypothetical protein